MMIEKYIDLINKYLKHKITVSEFETKYLYMFKNEKENIPEKYYTILDSFFSDIDMFCIDDELRDDGDLNENELRNSAQKVINLLKQYE
jgi:hypothetical protein